MERRHNLKPRSPFGNAALVPLLLIAAPRACEARSKAVAKQSSCPSGVAPGRGSPTCPGSTQPRPSLHAALLENLSTARRVEAQLFLHTLGRRRRRRKRSPAATQGPGCRGLGGSRNGEHCGHQAPHGICRGAGTARLPLPWPRYSLLGAAARTPRPSPSSDGCRDSNHSLPAEHPSPLSSKCSESNEKKPTLLTEMPKASPSPPSFYHHLQLPAQDSGILHHLYFSWALSAITASSAKI